MVLYCIGSMMSRTLIMPSTTAPFELNFRVIDLMFSLSANESFLMVSTHSVSILFFGMHLMYSLPSGANINDAWAVSYTHLTLPTID
jgi:hypothetical protein